jgi:hypothetical protein
MLVGASGIGILVPWGSVWTEEQVGVLECGLKSSTISYRVVSPSNSSSSCKACKDTVGSTSALYSISRILASSNHWLSVQEVPSVSNVASSGSGRGSDGVQL